MAQRLTQLFGRTLTSSITGINTVGNLYSNEGTFGDTAAAAPTGNTKLQVIGDAYVSGNLGIGSDAPATNLDIVGNANISGVATITSIEVGPGGINTTGAAVSMRNVVSTGIITATSFVGDGSALTNLPGEGAFNIGITSSNYVQVTAGIGTDAIETRDIFTGPGIAYSFPSTSSRTYVIESIHITNKSGNELYITGRQDYNGGSNVPIANRVIVPYQGALELLEEPTVANPQDIIRLQALTSQEEDAQGHNGGLDAFIVISEKQVDDYIGTGATITSADQEVFKADTKSAVVQSVRLVNYDNNIDIDASVSIFRNASAVGGGVRLGYLAYNLTIPKNSVVDILQKPKYLQSDDAIKVTASHLNSLAVTIAGRYTR